jgi:hypothetical protein
MPFGGCDVRLDLNIHGMLSISRECPDQYADGNLDCEDREDDHDN